MSPKNMKRKEGGEVVAQWSVGQSVNRMEDGGSLWGALIAYNVRLYLLTLLQQQH